MNVLCPKHLQNSKLQKIVNIFDAFLFLLISITNHVNATRKTNSNSKGVKLKPISHIILLFSIKNMQFKIQTVERVCDQTM